MIAEQAERYDDMAEAIKAVSEGDDQPLTSKERHLFSVAFKNVVDARRSSWRVVSQIVEKQKATGDRTEQEMAIDYRGEIENEITDICNEVLSLLDDNIVKTGSSNVEGKVFSLKMKGDYFRYLVEVASSEDKMTETTNRSFAAYKAATEAAESLAPTHVIRLELALNFSLFLYEIMHQEHEARSIAKKAFDDAIADLDELQEDSYRDSTLIMQLLRDNLTLWTRGSESDDEE